MNYEVIYTRIYIKDGNTRTWKNQTYEVFSKSEAEHLVNDWNRQADIMQKMNPNNGRYIYIQEAIVRTQCNIQSTWG